MGWARLDDGWHDHRKVAAAGLEAAGLWAMCLTWAHKDRRTNPASAGVVPDPVIVRLAGSSAKAKKLAARLHEAGMFDDHTGAGWPIHDFTQYLPKYDPEQNRENGLKGGRPKGSGKQSETKPVSKPVGGLVPEPEPVANRSESDPSRVGASARRNPVPVPEEQKLPPSAGAGSAAVVPISSADLVPANGVDVGGVVAEWIGSCSKRPPGAVISRVGKSVKALAEEGISDVDIRAGLAAWQAKGADPSTLPSFVNQAMNAQPHKTSQQRANDDMWQRAAVRAAAAEGAYR